MIVRRGLAFFIDLGFSLSLTIFITGLAGLVIPLDSGWIGLVIGPSLLLMFIYLFGAPSIFKNSLGRYFLRTRVVNEADGGRPSPRQCLIRACWIGFSPFEAIRLIRSKDKKRLGDQKAHTRVILDEKNTVHWAKRLVLGVLLLGVIGWSPVWMLGLGSANTNLYQAAVKYIQEREIGEAEYGGPGHIARVPRFVDMEGSEAVVVTRATWPKKSAYIYMELKRIDGNWTIKTSRIQDADPGIGYGYSYGGMNSFD